MYVHVHARTCTYVHVKPLRGVSALTGLLSSISSSWFALVALADTLWTPTDSLSMRSKGYSSCPVCVCVCLSVSPQAILAVRTITSKTKDTIVLSVEFEAIIKRRFFATWGGIIG